MPLVMRVELGSSHRDPNAQRLLPSNDGRRTNDTHQPRYMP
jgi:hypothetical protein